MNLLGDEKDCRKKGKSTPAKEVEFFKTLNSTGLRQTPGGVTRMPVNERKMN